jgi:hypothetical protein
MTRRSLNHWLLLATVAGAACTLDATGCGGSSGGTLGSGDDGGSPDATTGTTDSGGGGTDSEATDSGGRGTDSEATDSGGGGADSEAADTGGGGGNGDSAVSDSGNDSATGGGDSSTDAGTKADAADGSTCTPVTGTHPTYIVDPVEGSDTTGTGNTSVSASCAFQTITHALQVIGNAPAGTTIDIVNSAASGGVTLHGVTGTPTAGQEKFPITLPSNVTLATSGGPVTIQVPTGANGIVLAGNPSAIAGRANAALTIDGQSNTATGGVVVESPAATLSGVTIQNFGAAGISVNDFGGNASALTIEAGVQSNGNGTEGLSVQGTSTASINSTTTPIQFKDNAAHGIYVRGTAAVTVTGDLGAAAPGTSTVIASGNALAGIWIQQTAGTGARNALTGVVCGTSTQGNGLRIVPGSNVRVRNSWFLGNNESGIDIENVSGAVASTDISNIDLGTMGSHGDNVVQAPAGGSVNGNAGICLAIDAGANVALPAYGNVFGGTGATAVNCATTMATLRTAGNLGCANHADVGGNIIAFPNDGGAGNTINVTQCSY